MAMDSEIKMEFETSQPPAESIEEGASGGNEYTSRETEQEPEPERGMLASMIHLVDLCNVDIEQIMDELNRRYDGPTEEAKDTTEFKERCAALETKCVEIVDARGALQLLLSEMTD